MELLVQLVQLAQQVLTVLPVPLVLLVQPAQEFPPSEAYTNLQRSLIQLF